MNTLLLVLLVSLLSGHAVRAERMSITDINGTTVTAISESGDIWQYIADEIPTSDGIIAVLDDMGTVEIEDDEIIYVLH